MNTREKMQQAKVYIETKNYRDARKLLTGIEHPVAKKWLAKIDALQPPRKRRRWLWGIAAAVVVLALLFGAYVFLSASTGGYDGHLEARLFGYCVSTGRDNCGAWAHDRLSLYRDTVAACDKQYPDLNAQFKECLAKEIG